MKILVLGATGMAGHVISIYLSEKGHDVTAYSRREFSHCTNVLGDVFDLVKLNSLLQTGKFDAVINCIGILNQKCEANYSNSIFVNSFIPHHLVSVLANSKTRVIQMSTDCVFSGKSGNYKESSIPDGATLYDKTKALGEIIDQKNLTFRNSIIGPDINPNGIGLFNWFMKQTETINGYTRVVWTGVTTITLAKAMEKALEDNLTGLYHPVNNSNINKFTLLNLFNKKFCDEALIIQPCDDYILDKSLVNTRKDFNFIVPSYESMIQEMCEWMFEHKELYPHYF